MYVSVQSAVFISPRVASGVSLQAGNELPKPTNKFGATLVVITDSAGPRIGQPGHLS